jgi:hypothetical protein
MTEIISGILEKALGTTLEVARAFPADKFDFWPAPNMMTVAEQIDHLAHNLEYVIGPIGESLGKPIIISSATNPQARLEHAIRHVRDVIGAVPEADWMRTVAYPDGFSMSILRAALTMLEHDAHHRGQLIVALRILGVDPPKRWGGR